MPRPIKLLHLITGLNTGGAEIMLYRLLSHLDRSQFDPVVVSLMDRGTVGPKIEAFGIPVYTLGLNPKRPYPWRLHRLKRIVHRHRPHLIQGWMYHGNLAAAWVQLRWRQRASVVWNVRQSLYSLAYEKRLTAWLIRLGAHWSHRSQPCWIVYNARLSAQQHEALGYCAKKRVVIPNGFDLERFKPCPQERNRLRDELGLPSSALLIGLVSRFHPMKDHATFLRAAGLLTSRVSNVHFVLVGWEVDQQNVWLTNSVREFNLVDHVHLLGAREDIPHLMAALDIFTSSSWAEGFPNVVGEAMACGVPCAVTDVGDSAYLVGETGLVVPPRDPEALARAWQRLIELGPAGRQRLGAAARQRVQEHFSLERVVHQYESLYKRIIES